MGQATATITFTAAPTPTFLGGNFTLSATTNSDGALIYNYVSGPCAQVSGGTFSSSGAGTCAVAANTAATANFTAAASSTNVSIAKALATVTLGSLNPTYNGSPEPVSISATPTGLTVNVTYNGASTVPTTAGSYPVVATVSDPNYQGSSSGALVIGKATPTVTWTNPATIAYGTALGATQLNASASFNGSSLPGNFTYTPAAGTVLGAGSGQLLSVSFAATDSTDFSTATATANITVTPALSISVSSLTYPAQLVGSSSSAQTVTLSNAGVVPVSISGIAATANFAETDTCAGSVAASGTCTLNVTFKPTAAGSLTGTLTITDNDNGVAGSTQTVSLSGTGQDFSFTPPSGSTTAVTITPGQPGTYTLSVGGEDGLTGTVSFTCTGAPSEATCTVSPNPVTVGSTATNVIVTVTTTPASAGTPFSPKLPPSLPGVRGRWMLTLILAAIVWAFARRKQRSRWQLTLAPLAAGLLLALAMAGCGGGGSGVHDAAQPRHSCGNLHADGDRHHGFRSYRHEP